MLKQMLVAIGGSAGSAKNENRYQDIAVILSGTGTDGVNGSAAIKSRRYCDSATAFQ